MPVEHALYVTDAFLSLNLKKLVDVIKFNFYVSLLQVKDQLYSAGFMCDVDVDPGDTMNKKIRNAQLAQYNFILGKSKHIMCIV